MRPILLTFLVVLIAHSVAAQDAPLTAKVEGVFVLPKDLASFEGRLVEVRLYKYDPRIAGKAADLVEKLDLKGFAHTQGNETKKEFVVGAKNTLEPKMGYYVTLFVLDGAKRTHIGECEHSKNNLCRVLTDKHPNKISMTLREVKK